MKLAKAIEVLEEWVKVDREYIEIPFAETGSDFDKFCEEKNKAICCVLEAVKRVI